MDFQPRPQQADLLAEELTDAEVRTLLGRLGSREFGGSENATVGAIVEATGSDAATVGRLLAEIRKEDFEERFGLQLKDHGRRIKTLEDSTKRVEPKPARSKPALDYYQQVALDRMAREERQKEAMRPFAVVLVAVAFLVMVLLLVASADRGKAPRWEEWSVSTEVKDGTLIRDSHGNTRVKLRSGGERTPTNQEAATMSLLDAQRDRK